MMTQDIRFRVLADDWQRTGRTFAGLVFAHQRKVSFGEMVVDLELIAKATDPKLVRHSGSIGSNSFPCRMATHQSIRALRVP
jgi:hypothetical protein